MQRGTGAGNKIGKVTQLSRGGVRLATMTALLAAFPVAASAQATGGQGEEFAVPDVKVTAERRETSLQKTAVSVGVIGEDELQTKNISLLRDLAGTTAGLVTPASFSPSLQYLYIRGIGTAAPTLNGAVALYIDDVYIPRIINSGVFGSPDLQQIEVLRGPQGTLYGQNTSAGAIKVISREPSEERQAWVSAGVGSFGGYEFKGYYTGAINPGLLSASLAVSKQKNDGNVDNVQLNRKVNAVDTEQFRAKFKLTPGNGIDALLSIDGLADRSDNGSYTRTDRGYPARQTADGRSLGIHNNAGGISLRVTDRIDEHLTFKSITAYRAFSNKPDPWSYDGVPESRFGWQLNLNQHQLSQEFQLLADYGKWSVTSGLIGFRENFKVDRPNYTNNVYGGISSETDVASIGVYSQAHYKATDALGFTAGLRYNKQRDSYDWRSYTSNASLQPVAITGGLTGLEQRTHTLTPKVGVDYQWTPQLFSYASVTRGEKAGGYNPVAGALAIARVPVNPEKVTAYEVGVKNSAWDGRLQTNVSLFYNNFSDYQAAVTNPIVNGAVVNGAVTVNAGKAHTYGAEVEALLKPSRALDLKFALALLQTRFDKFLNPTGAANSNYEGNQLPNAPHLTAGISGGYVLPVSLPGATRVTGDVNYEARSYIDTANSLKVPGHVNVNLGTSYTSADGHWTTSLGVRNLLNRTYPVNIASVPSLNIYGVAYNLQRSWQATVRYDF